MTLTKRDRIQLLAAQWALQTSDRLILVNGGMSKRKAREVIARLEQRQAVLRRQRAA